MSGKQRIDGAAAFLLHAYPFSETSLIIEIFARQHGRLALLARGARRPRSALRGMLLAFQPLELGWFGGGEVRTLAKAEWLGGMPFLNGEALLVGYYLNELLLKLLPREDAHMQLYDAYVAALQAIATGATETMELRRFEKVLLAELGYGLTLERDAAGASIDPDGRYRYLVENGAVRANGDDAGLVLTGKTLLDLAADRYEDSRTLAEAKQLMRQLLAHHLNGQTLQTRRIFIELDGARK